MPKITVKGITVVTIRCFLLILLHLFFALNLIAQNPNTTKADKKINPDGIPGDFPLFARKGLSARGIKKAPKFVSDDNIRARGRIVIAICVNKKGKVVSATYVPAKSTIKDDALIQAVIQNAKAYRFARSKKRKKDCGEIDYNFVY